MTGSVSSRGAARRIIAIDGPAASGKSTTARRVAERLGFVHLNSGLLYRAITWRAIRDSWPPEPADLEERVARVRIDLVPAGSGLGVVVDGEDAEDALHGQPVSARVSQLAAAEPVRAAVLARLRAAGEEFDLVCDGRDIGTTVFPGADVKVYLIAAAAERARRRLRDLGLEATDDELASETGRLVRRDEADATRALSPLRKAPGAIEIDTTDLAPEDVVELIVTLAARVGIDAERHGE